MAKPNASSSRHTANSEKPAANKPYSALGHVTAEECYRDYQRYQAQIKAAAEHTTD